MKRLELLKHLQHEGCQLFREGGNHSVFVNLQTKQISTVPRHTEIHPFLARKICRDLGVRPITKK